MLIFTKAHAYGNDFLYVERSAVLGASLDQLAREMCDRHSGVGADGLIVYTHAGGVAAMRLFNADGSTAEVSGNGVRALAAILLLHDKDPHAAIAIETAAGTKRVERLEDSDSSGSRQTFRTAMGMPSMPEHAAISIDGEVVDSIVLNMGNPQCIILGPLPDEARFMRVGAALERHARFPEGTNVEFAYVESPGRVRIRIWERGVGPTLSSGTGSCASLVAAAAFGGASRDAEVIAPGGSQRIEWRDDGVYLTGWAEVICHGEWLRHFSRTQS